MKEWYDIEQLTEKYCKIDDVEALMTTCKRDIVALIDLKDDDPDAERATSFISKLLFWLNGSRPNYPDGDLDLIHRICDRFKG